MPQEMELELESIMIRMGHKLAEMKQKWNTIYNTSDREKKEELLEDFEVDRKEYEALKTELYKARVRLY